MPAGWGREPIVFPTRKGLMLLIQVAHPSERPASVWQGDSGDMIAPGAGTTLVRASSYHLLTPSPQVLQMLQPRTSPPLPLYC